MIRFLISLYILVIIFDTILSYLPNLRHQPIVIIIRRLASFSLNPIRKLLPRELPFDISPLIVILGLQLIELLW